MRFRKNRSGASITPLKSTACLFAFVLICCSLLSIYWKIPPVHASAGLQQANNIVTSKLAHPDRKQTSTPTLTQTSTSTPVPTTTNTPTPTQTSTPTATATSLLSPTVTNTPLSPSPTVRVALTPTPTFASLATPTAGTQQNGGTTNQQAPLPGASPVSSSTAISSIPAQGTDTGQTQTNSLATTNNSVDQSNPNVRQSDSNFPYSTFTIAIGSLILLGSLCILGWVVVRRRLLSLPSSKYPPSGAAPWSRIRNFD